MGKESGTPETDVEVTFQLVEKNEELSGNDCCGCFAIHDCP